MHPLAQQFMDRFAGLTRAHGQYTVNLSPDEKGKMTGSRGTRPNKDHPDGTVTVQLWSDHLEGKIGLGIVPIRDDSTVLFAAGDIDVYPLDLVALQGQIVRMDLPLIATRTKSGGAHLYCFFKTPVPAVTARRKMKEWVTALGYPSIEIFPKQDTMDESSFGNWINMPYCGGDNTNRYAVKPDGKPIGMKEYLKVCAHIAIKDEDTLKATEPKNIDDWQDAPPCLQTGAQQGGFSEGGRNNALYNIGIYLKKRYDTKWQKYLEAYNTKYLVPPLPQREAQVIGNSLHRKNYNYKCKDTPICELCNRDLCVTRAFGVSAGEGQSGVTFGPLTKVLSVPVNWVWEINGKPLELTTEELVNQNLFGNQCVEFLSVRPSKMKAGAWDDLINDKMANAIEVPAPADASKEGAVWDHLADFCTSKVQAKALDEIMMGKPFTDEKTNRTYFRSGDFMKYLTQQRVSGISERELWRFLRKKAAEYHSKTLKGKKCSFWSVPAFPAQTEDFTVPRTPTPEAM